MTDVKSSSAMQLLKKSNDLSLALVHAGLAVAHRLHVQCTHVNGEPEEFTKSINNSI